MLRRRGFEVRYIRGEGGEVVLSDDTHLPVSRRMKGQMMEMLERI